MPKELNEGEKKKYVFDPIRENLESIKQAFQNKNLLKVTQIDYVNLCEQQLIKEILDLNWDSMLNKLADLCILDKVKEVIRSKVENFIKNITIENELLNVYKTTLQISSYLMNQDVPFIFPDIPDDKIDISKLCKNMGISELSDQIGIYFKFQPMLIDNMALSENRSRGVENLPIDKMALKNEFYLAALSNVVPAGKLIVDEIIKLDARIADSVQDKNNDPTRSRDKFNHIMHVVEKVLQSSNNTKSSDSDINSAIERQLKNSNSELYKALNMQRHSWCFGRLGDSTMIKDMKKQLTAIKSAGTQSAEKTDKSSVKSAIPGTKKHH